MRESPSSEVSLHGGLAKTADPHRDPHAETSGRKQWKQGRGRVFQFQRKRSKTSGKRYFQNFSTLCNQQVGGSSPSTSSNLSAAQQSEYGGIPEWPKGADCKSVVSDFGGSNPPSPTKAEPDEPDVFAWLFCFLNDLYDRWHIHSCVFSCARIEKEAPAHLHDGQVLFCIFS